MSRGTSRGDAPGRRRALRGLRDERGLVSLAEVLVAMAIIGLAAVSIVSGYGVANLSASHHQEITRADHVARMVAEHIESQDYVPCVPGVPPAYEVAGAPYPAGWTAADVSLSFGYWDGDTLPITTSPNFLPGCPGDQGLQKVTITASSPTERGARTIEVIKRGES